MLCTLEYLLCVLLFSEVVICEAAPKLARFGWCCTRHRPPVPAQSGYTDSQGNRYCTRCFRVYCPELYAEKRRKRQAACGYCGEAEELQQGFCRTCRRARACASCGEFNMDSDAVICVSCFARRIALGARAEQLASWCMQCTTEEER